MPCSCSVKKQMALAASAQDPPPKETRTSASSLRAAATPDRTTVTGTCEVTSSKTPTRLRPSEEIRASPSSDTERPAVVTSMTRRAPTSRRTLGTRPTAPGPKCTRWVKPVWIHSAAAGGRMLMAARSSHHGPGLAAELDQLQVVALGAQHGHRAVVGPERGHPAVPGGRTDGGVDGHEVGDHGGVA